MKLTDLIGEGKFGPGTQTAVNPSNKNFKGMMGAIENKRRPESIYFTLETWVKPKLSLLKATSLGSAEPEEVARQAIKEFESELKRLTRELRGIFDTLYFEPDSIIFTYDFDGAAFASPGKAQFFKMEINIDTVNDIDANEEPAPNRKTGAVEHIHFDQFKKPIKDTVNKIVKLPVFNRSQTVDFQKTKRG